LAAADSHYFFSSGNWQQPTTSIFLIEAIGSSRQQVFFTEKEFIFLREEKS
jgi:hypothetical protein